jgi:hypothetical protein
MPGFSDIYAGALAIPYYLRACEKISESRLTP